MDYFCTGQDHGRLMSVAGSTGADWGIMDTTWQQTDEDYLTQVVSTIERVQDTKPELVDAMLDYALLRLSRPVLSR